MPVRHKILALAAALILLFAAAIGLSVVLGQRVKDRMAGITGYHLPLSQMLAEFDTNTYRYELLLNRLLVDQEVAADALDKAETAMRRLTTATQQGLQQADQLLDQGMYDARNTVEDRIMLARVKGRLGHLLRDIAPYTNIGDTVIDALRRNAIPEAGRRVQGLERYDDSFAVETAMITQMVGGLAQGAVESTLNEQRGEMVLDVGLFLASAAVGLGLATMLARRLATSMRELLAGARAVEGGDLTVMLPSQGRDEIALLAGAFNRMVTELKSRERIKDTFGKFLDPRVVARLVDNSGDSGDAADRRVATVFFSDIKGFSGLSETLTAAAMVKLLNSYFGRMTELVRGRNGVIDKYIGDAVMAFWAAPFTPGDAHAGEAVLTALEQQAALVQFRQELPQILGLRRNVPEFKIRIGIATGEVVLGTIGSQAVKSFTVIGDIVNLASRIEGANKAFGTEILVAEDTWKLASGQVEGREVDRLVVAGKTEPVSVYEPMAPVGKLSPEQQRLIEHFGNGLAAYRAGEWMLAKSAFRAALEAMPDDGPSKVFLARIARLEHAPAAEWDGIWRLSEK